MAIWFGKTLYIYVCLSCLTTIVRGLCFINWSQGKCLFPFSLPLFPYRQWQLS